MSSANALRLTIETAEKYVDRIDSCQFLDILPKKTPLILLQQYLAKVIENSNSKQRNLQVILWNLVILYLSHLFL
jgi:hypothetical protein